MRFMLGMFLILGLILPSTAAAHHVSDQQVKAAIRAVFSEEPAQTYALHIAFCETGETWDTHTVGAIGEVSMFQFHPIHWFKTWQLYRPKRKAYITPAALVKYPRLAANLAFTMSRGGRHWYPWYICSGKWGVPR